MLGVVATALLLAAATLAAALEAGPAGGSSTASGGGGSVAGHSVCLDNLGQPVDWWFQYKLPGICEGSQAGDRRGNVTLYVDANSVDACGADDARAVQVRPGIPRSDGGGRLRSLPEGAGCATAAGGGDR